MAMRTTSVTAQPSATRVARPVHDRAARDGRRIRADWRHGLLGGWAARVAWADARRCGDAAAKDPIDRARIEAGFRGSWCIRARWPDLKIDATRRRCGCWAAAMTAPDIIDRHSRSHVCEAARSEGAGGIALLRSRAHGFGLRATPTPVDSELARRIPDMASAQVPTLAGESSCSASSTVSGIELQARADRTGAAVRRLAKVSQDRRGVK